MTNELWMRNERSGCCCNESVDYARSTIHFIESRIHRENTESVKTLEESREIIFYRTCSLSIVLNCMCQTCKITRFTQRLWIVVL